MHIENLKEDIAKLELRLDRIVKWVVLFLSGVVFPLLVGSILLGIEALIGR